jgi:hypothetical protein
MDGTASGPVVMSPGHPFGNGHSVRIWLRH